MRCLAWLSVAALFSCLPAVVCAQESYFSEWFQRVDKTQAEQPHWITPMFTTTPRLEEEFRYDFGTQHTASGDVTNIGGGKGLELIPTEHTEIIVSPPPYISHENPRAVDGFGDMSFVLKYRFLAGNEEHGNYILTAFLGASIPTGSYRNGAENATLTPTIALGKGWHQFDFQSTFGAAIPVSDTSRLGIPLAWNTAFQYHILKKLWPEMEVNATFFPKTPNQVFLSPGLVVGRLHLWRRLGLTIGGGIQIAATHFHTFDHNRVLSLRFPF
jgi:Putative MetA-pathway of phenol degradation